MTPATAHTTVGGTVTLSAMMYDSVGTPVTTAVLAWSSTDTTVAYVSGTGVVTGKKAGTATVTAGAGIDSGAATIIVGSGSVVSNVSGVGMRP